MSFESLISSFRRADHPELRPSGDSGDLQGKDGSVGKTRPRRAEGGIFMALLGGG